MIHIAASALAEELQDFQGEADSVVVFVFGPEDKRWLSWSTEEGAHRAASGIFSAIGSFLERYKKETGIDLAQQDGEPCAPAQAMDAERQAATIIRQLIAR